MKIGVMADSHDHVPRVRRAVELFNREEVGLVVHAGDFVAPFAVEPLAELRSPVLAVFGNNDGERLGLAGRFEGIGELHDHLGTVTLTGRRIAVVHYPELAEPLARSGEYQLVIFGHTHQVEERIEKGLLLNPGEVGGWLTGRSTVALVDLETMRVEIRELA